ncbi:MAG: hypothetical protein RMN25_02060 [Anaerolineae bacterium]|nr:hypothetical protein [Thermoflexales bacterium]MDW8406540.1 hypothetical protein [Anaerolineae bacterium]
MSRSLLRFRTWMSLIVVFALAPISSPRLNAENEKPLHVRVLEQAAHTFNRPLARLRVADLAEVTLPLSGQQVVLAKVEDGQTGDLYGVGIDADGSSLTFDAVRQLWRAEYAARYGRLHPHLLDRLGTMQDEDRIVVGLWLKADIRPQARPEMNHTPNTGHETGAAEAGAPESARPTPRAHPPTPTRPAAKKDALPSLNSNCLLRPAQQPTLLLRRSPLPGR